MCVCFRLLVGAPQAKAIRGQKSAITGGFYKCELSSPCTRVIFDDNGEQKYCGQFKFVFVTIFMLQLLHFLLFLSVPVFLQRI